MNELSGIELGAYRLYEIIGKGGMATVYRGYQPSMDREVAIKIISSDLATDPEFMARFEREAKIVAQLQHPHILPVYDFGRDNGQTFLVMRLMTGGSLAAELRAGPIAARRVLQLVRQVASALDYAHQRGIVHRDLKPTNILLDDVKNAYLTDFGIAKMLAGGPTTGLTATGAVMGTPTYMAPEQWRAEAVDARTDVYALGVIVYQMLLGQVPFSAETPHGLMYQHLDKQPPPAHTLKPDLPLSIEPVIARALAKLPANRYSSAGELAADLERALLAPARLPEQTDFEARRVESLAAGQEDGFTALAQEELEDELLALGEEDSLELPPSATSAPTVPPTGPLPPPRPAANVLPPRYVPPPPPPAGSTAPAGPYYSPAAAPSYQPPAPQSYPPPSYAVPDRRGLERNVWVVVLGVIGVLVVGAVIAGLALLLSAGGGGDEAPTLPPATLTFTPEFRPGVVIQAPPNDSTVNLGDTVTIQFLATHREALTRVELRRLGRVLDSVAVSGQTSYQGTFRYTPDSTGTHRLELVAYSGDVQGDPASLSLIVR